jgi:hypothetical protein
MRYEAAAKFPINAVPLFRSSQRVEGPTKRKTDSSAESLTVGDLLVTSPFCLR